MQTWSVVLENAKMALKKGHDSVLAFRVLVILVTQRLYSSFQYTEGANDGIADRIEQPFFY